MVNNFCRKQQYLKQIAKSIRTGSKSFFRIRLQQEVIGWGESNAPDN